MHVNMNVILQWFQPQKAYVANVDLDAVKRVETEVRIATAYVLRTIKTESNGIPILLMVDANRRDLYAAAAVNPVQWMNDLLKEQAVRYHIPLLDLTDAFTASYAKDGHWFDASPYDNHWNAHGHAVAAVAIAPLIRANFRY